jgi:hypothetical protein
VAEPIQPKVIAKKTKIEVEKLPGPTEQPSAMDQDDPIYQSFMKVSQKFWQEMHPKFLEAVKKDLEATSQSVIIPKRDDIIYISTVNRNITFTNAQVMSPDFKYHAPLIRMTKAQNAENISHLFLSVQDMRVPLTFHSKFLEFIRDIERHGLGDQAEKVLGYFKSQKEIKEKFIDSLRSLSNEGTNQQTEPNPRPEPTEPISPKPTSPNEIIKKPEGPKPPVEDGPKPTETPEVPTTTTTTPGGNDPMPVPKDADVDSLLARVEQVIEFCGLADPVTRETMYPHVLNYVQENPTKDMDELVSTYMHLLQK